MDNNKILNTNLYLDNAEKTSSIFFDWDRWFHYVIWSAVYLLIFRIFFTFFFAFMFSEQWYIEKIFGWLPIIAFNAEMEIFTKLNSYSLLAASFSIFIIFCFHIFSSINQDRIYQIYAWYLAVIMTFIQYLVLIFINNFINFSIYSNLWLIFFGLIVVASILLYWWKKHLSQYYIKKIIKK
jgi:hypothetical protein